MEKKPWDKHWKCQSIGLAAAVFSIDNLRMPYEKKLPDRKRFGRSALSNGQLFLERIDGRGKRPRRFRDLILALTREVEKNGQLTVIDEQLIRCSAMLCLLLEDQQLRLAQGKSVDLELAQRCAGTVSRTLRQLGVSRDSREPQPESLEQYLGELGAEFDEPEESDELIDENPDEHPGYQLTLPRKPLRESPDKPRRRNGESR